jgi:hypothetical protein
VKATPAKVITKLQEILFNRGVVSGRFLPEWQSHHDNLLSELDKDSNITGNTPLLSYISVIKSIGCRLSNVIDLD